MTRARKGVEEVGSGIRRLSRGICNFYLVEDGGSFVVVDAGTPKDWSLLAAAIGELRSLDAVLLSHAHPDHTGFAERARAEAGATVSVHEADAAAARTGKTGKNDGSVSKYLFRVEFYRTALSLARRGGAKIVPIAEVSTFADGDVIDVPGRPRAIHAPGHTPGSAALFFEGLGALLTGDVLVTHNALTGRGGPQIMPSGLNADTGLALRSLDALAGIEAATLLPGHGVPWTDGVGEAIRLAKQAGPS
ncbi:MAG TPA: MBL fold metallo-hydrolase [Actinomycetota bacterium]|jgi:glyoxylase-like metal-dependent hydrolase (beta-lactamase superfamily II)